MREEERRWGQWRQEQRKGDGREEEMGDDN